MSTQNTPEAEKIKKKKTDVAVVQNSNLPASYSQDEINLIKNTVAKDATDLELKFFMSQCQRTGLDPITRQIYFVKDKNGKVMVQTSIDGFRLIAERSKKYEGQAKQEWCGADGVWKDVWLSKMTPSAARIGVWKQGFKEPLYAVALFEEYAQRYKDGNLMNMWKKMPALMISKVAESLALRKAFPNEMSGIYTTEELPPPDDDIPLVPNQNIGVTKASPVGTTTHQAVPVPPIADNEIQTQLNKLSNLLKACGMEGKTPASKKNREQILDQVYGTHTAGGLGKLLPVQIELGMKQIVEFLNPELGSQEPPPERQPGDEVG